MLDVKTMLFEEYMEYEMTKTFHYKEIAEK